MSSTAGTEQAPHQETKRLKARVAQLGRLNQQYENENDTLRARVAELEWAKAECRRSTAARRASEQRFQQFMNAVADVVYRYDPANNRYDFVSPSFEAQTGHSLDALRADPRGLSRTITHPDDIERVLEEVADHIRKGPGAGSIVTEYRVVRKDGAVIWVQDVKTPEFGADGKLRRIDGVVSDVTSYKHVEERLSAAHADLEKRVQQRTAELARANTMLRREVEERRQAEVAVRAAKAFTDNLISSMQDGLLVTDLRGTHIDVNPAFCRMTGFSRGELIGVGPPHPYWPPDAREEIEATSQKMLRGDRAEFELTLMRKDGERFPALVSVSHIKDEQGKMVSYFATVKDTAERKRAEERVAQQQLELAHVARLSTMGEMASGIAHELNQPLAAILNYAEAFKQAARSGQAEPVELLADLEEIAAEAQRAGDIVHRLRSFVRKREPRRSSIDLNELVQDAVRFVEYEARLKRIRIRLELAEGLPRVQGDATLFQQVVLNLITNAMEAMAANADGARELTIETSIGDGDELAVAVRDTGRGSPCESVDTLFEPFFTTKPEGLGLGLSISRSIVEAEGGRLTATPNRDRGMTFRFTLPITQGDSHHGT